MDWEMYDLDGEDVVLRNILTTSSKNRPWKGVQPTKPMPRSAGSVHRPSRCEYVMELVQFCHDYDAVLQYSNNQFPRKQHPPSDGHSRQLKSQLSRSSLHHKPASRTSRRKGKARKPKSRQPPAVSTEKLETATNRTEPLNTTANPSSRANSQSYGLQRLPLAEGASDAANDDTKDVDCECHYPGVAVLPTPRSFVVDTESNQFRTELPFKENEAEYALESRKPIHFVNPWNRRSDENRVNDISLDDEKLVGVSPPGHRSGRTSDLSQHSSGNNSPTTVATSPFESSQFREGKQTPPLPSGDSKYIDSQYLPQRRSSKKMHESTQSNLPSLSCRLSSHYSQEHLISCIQDSLDVNHSESAAVTSHGNSKETESPDGPPQGRMSTDEDAGQLPRRSLSRSSASGSVIASSRSFNYMSRPRLASVPLTQNSSSNDHSGDRFHCNDGSHATSRFPTARSKSFDALSSTCRKEDVSTIKGVSSHADLSSDWFGEKSPLSTAKPSDGPDAISSQRNMSRSARIFALRMRDTVVARKLSHANARGEAGFGEFHTEEGYESSRGSPTPTRKQFPRKLSTHIPQSPRTQGPSSPPDIPLPADPPIPPSRCSSRNQTHSSRAITAYRELSSDLLVQQASFPTPPVENRYSPVNSRAFLSGNNKGENTSYFLDEARQHKRYPSPSLASSDALAPRNDSPPPDLPSEGRNAIIMPENNENKGSDSYRHEWYHTRQNTALSSPTNGSPAYDSRCNSPHQLDAQLSRSHTFPESQPPQVLESRVAFLERQNKMLQAALVAALDVGVPAGHDTDSLRSPTTTAPASGYASPVGEHNQSDTMDFVGQTYVDEDPVSFRESR